MSGQHRRDAQRRTATSMPKTALPPFLVETVNIAAADPGLFMRSLVDRGGVLLAETPTRPTCKWLGTISVKCTCVTSSRPASSTRSAGRIVGEDQAPIKNEATGPSCDTTKTRLHEQADRWTRTADDWSVGAGAARTPTGPGAARPAIAASTASSSAMRLSAGRQDGA